MQTQLHTRVVFSQLRVRHLGVGIGRKIRGVLFILLNKWYRHDRSTHRDVHMSVSCPRGIPPSNKSSKALQNESIGVVFASWYIHKNAMKDNLFRSSNFSCSNTPAQVFPKLKVLFYAGHFRLQYPTLIFGCNWPGSGICQEASCPIQRPKEM